MDEFKDMFKNMRIRETKEVLPDGSVSYCRDIQYDVEQSPFQELANKQHHVTEDGYRLTEAFGFRQGHQTEDGIMYDWHVQERWEKDGQE